MSIILRNLNHSFICPVPLPFPVPVPDSRFGIRDSGFGIRDFGFDLFHAPLMKTLDRRVETLGFKSQIFKLHSF